MAVGVVLYLLTVCCTFVVSTGSMCTYMLGFHFTSKNYLSWCLMTYYTSIVYDTGIRNTEYLEIFREISENRDTYRTRMISEWTKGTPNTQCVTVRKEHGTQERNTRNLNVYLMDHTTGHDKTRDHTWWPSWSVISPFIHTIFVVIFSILLSILGIAI